MVIRPAQVTDIPAIMSLIQELADCEKYTGPIASKEYIEQSFFNEPSPIQIYVIEVDGRVIGMGHIMVFPSTYAGKHQLLLQDFVVEKSFRNQGYGKEFIQFLCKMALEKNYKKITWNFLEWNEHAAPFYRKIGEITGNIANCTLDEKKMQTMLNDHS